MYSKYMIMKTTADGIIKKLLNMLSVEKYNLFIFNLDLIFIYLFLYGKCSLTSNEILFTNLNSSLTYNQVFIESNVLLPNIINSSLFDKICFAYKIPMGSATISSVNFQLFYQRASLINANARVLTNADNNWHYLCVDIYNSYLTSQSTTYSSSSLILYQVIIQF